MSDLFKVILSEIFLSYLATPWLSGGFSAFMPKLGLYEVGSANVQLAWAAQSFAH
jgi:hypothetical protein